MSQIQQTSSLAPSLAPSQTSSQIQQTPSQIPSLGGGTPVGTPVGTPSLAAPHPRDALIVFEADSHKYTCAGESGYMSVTTWNHTHFPEFDADAIITKMMSNKRTWLNSPYYGKTREEIKAGWEKNRDEAAAAGTAMHYAIECYYRGETPHAPLGETPTPPNSGEGSSNNISSNSAEGSSNNGEEGSTPDAGVRACVAGGQSPHFIAFLAAHPHLKPYRTEWTIFNEDVRIAGTVDMIYENESDGTLMIYDWKRCKDIKKTNNFGAFAITECVSHLPDTNYWHYALQLNTYKTILERKYGKKIKEMFLVGLHPNLPKYKLYTVPVLEKEMTELFAFRMAQL